MIIRMIFAVAGCGLIGYFAGTISTSLWVLGLVLPLAILWARYCLTVGRERWHI